MSINKGLKPRDWKAWTAYGAGGEVNHGQQEMIREN
jgi:hypothetical protein